MQDIQPELVEKYQILLQKDPKSQVFAPLAEVYRKMGLVEEAFRIAVRGVQFNPAFGGGRIALAKVFLDRDNLPGAVEELEKAVELSPDNILAHSLLGDCFLKSKKPKDALRSFKMVLFLAPNNEKAQKAVRKLESLTADEYDEDLFEMKHLAAAVPQEAPRRRAEDIVEPVTSLRPLAQPGLNRDLERILSLSDAYIVRNDLEKAQAVLLQGEMDFGSHPEIVKRFKLVNQRGFPEDVSLESKVGQPPSTEEGAGGSSDGPEEPKPQLRDLRRLALDSKIELLQSLLKRLHDYS